MIKMTVHQLAKDLGTNSKELLSRLKELDINVKNHMNSLEELQVKLIKSSYKEKTEQEIKEKTVESKRPAKTTEEKAKTPPVARTNQGQTNYRKDKHTGTEGQKRDYQKPTAPKRNTMKDLKIPAVETGKDKDLNKEKKAKPKTQVKKKEYNRQTKGKNRLVDDIGILKNKFINKGEMPVKREYKKSTKPVVMGEIVAVKHLSEKTGVSVAEIIKKLMGLGVMATINEELDFDTASILMEEFKIKLELKKDVSYEEMMIDRFKSNGDEELKHRPPIVVVMGHVDHGKTSLLDSIRKTTVTEQEAGGITQHIGAYQVVIKKKKITFLDTPGHEAFTSMRARGAKVTDIAILVVAADDGVMPQTVEAINHAKVAETPLIVAINKIDKPGANPDRVKQELTEHGILVEEWGGETICVNVSAITKEGIGNLLEMVLLVAEMQELTADPNRSAIGTIIEAELDKGRGPVATVLIQNGTLKVGESIVAGTTHGRVRAMIDEKGNRTEEAGPSVPVEVLGLSDVPEAGDILYAVQDEKLAKQVTDERKDKIKEKQINSKKISLDGLFNQIKEGELKNLNLIVKADVQGSVEAVKQALEKLTNEEVKINCIHGGVGAITESDIMLATASNAIIIGFNTRPQPNALASAKKESIDIRLYSVIYDAIDDIQNAIKGMLDPQFVEKVLGCAMVREVFKITNSGTIAGCMVTNGKITRNSKVRIIRDSIVVRDGSISSLKRFKDDVKEVNTGYECGIGIENFNDIKQEDIIEAYIIEEIIKD